MRKIILSVFLLLGSSGVFAVSAYDVQLNIRNSTNTAYMPLIPSSPTTTDGIFFFNNAAHTAIWVAPGNLTNVGGVLYAPQADWNAVSGFNVIANKPTIPTDNNQLANGSGYLTSVTGVTPASLSTTLGSYVTAPVLSSSLSSKYDVPSCPTSNYIRGDGSCQVFPSIPASQVNADWSSASGVTQILNKPSLATVATSGSYNDLTSKPTIQTIQRARVQTDASGNYTWTYPVAYGAGVVPVISAISESASSTVPQGVQIVGVPTNTSATFKVINLPSTSVLSIVVLGAPTAAQAYIHLTAIAP